MLVGRIVTAAFTVTLILSVGTAHADKEVEFGKIADEEWQQGAPDDYPEANAVYTLSRAKLAIGRHSIVTDYLFRIKVLTEAGAEEVGEKSIRWHDKYDKIKNFEAHTISPDGKKQKVEKNSIFTKTSGSYKVRTFSFPSVEPGCILECKFTNVSENFRNLESWYFQTDVYTLKSSFSVEVPSGYTYNVLYMNVPPQFKQPSMEERPDLDGNISQGATIRTYTWTRENLPPITDEPYMSSEDNYRSSLRFQIVGYEDPWNKLNFLESWDELGSTAQRWYLDDYCNKSKDAKRLAQEITEGLTDPEEKSRAIYEYVTSEYKTVYDYASYYYAHDKMSELLETKNGSGEGKNLLLIEMHKGVDIPAWPVLIGTRDHARFDPGFPDLRQFNYMIAFVQFTDGYEFLDAASSLSPYGLLPPRCLTTGGLLLDGNESQLVKIGEPGIFSGRTDRTRMYVDADGLVTCSTDCNFRGYYASRYGRRFEKATPQEFIEDYFVGRLNTEYTLGEYECRLDSADCFVMTADFTAEDLVTQLDNNILIKPVSYAFRSNPFKSEKRFFPVDFNYPFTYTNAVEVFIDGRVEQYTMPEDMALDIGGASFSRECHRTDTSATLVSKLIISKPEFLPTAYTKLRDLFDQIAMASEDEITAILATTE